MAVCRFENPSGVYLGVLIPKRIQRLNRLNLLHTDPAPLGFELALCFCLSRSSFVFFSCICVIRGVGFRARTHTRSRTRFAHNLDPFWCTFCEACKTRRNIKALAHWVKAFPPPAASEISEMRRRQSTVAAASASSNLPASWA